MAIADPHPLNTDAPTQETGSIPRVSEQERRRGFARLPQIAPGRYLGIEDAGEIVLFPLTADVMHIGRSPAADVVFDDSSVSRRHALITRRGETLVILDDRSLNGVHVNGERVKEANLSNGDVIVLGQVTLRFIDVPA